MNLSFDGNRLTFGAAYLIYNEPPVLADFALSSEVVIVGDSLQIINKSSRADSFVWKLNGAIVSNIREVSIDTNRPIGGYALALTATRDGQTSTKTKTFNIVADPVKPSDVSGLIVSADLQITSSPATDNKGIAGYITQRKTNNGDWAALSSPALTFTDREDLPNDPAMLSYRRKAIDTSGNLSENWSNVATIAYQPLKAIISVSGFSGTVTISAVLSGSIAPVGARFAVDGAPIGGEDLTDPYSIIFDTTTLENGGHTFGVLARNQENQTALSTIGVNITNPIAPIGEVFVYNEIRIPFYHGDPEEVWSDVMRTHPYEDGGTSFNELSDTPPIEWRLVYNGLKPEKAAIFDAHFSTYRLSRPFTFIDKWGNTNTNVRYKEYRKSHNGNVSSDKTRELVFIKYP